MYFDIYLYQRCLRPPDLHDLVDQISAARDPLLLARLQERRPSAFLGLDLPEEAAHALRRRIKQCGARAHVAPSAYREPKVSIEEARAIAERAIAQRRESRYPTYTFGEVTYGGEGPWWWIFGAGSEQLQAEGWIPGAIIEYVDKLDGHLWQNEEMERMVRAQE